MNQKFVRYQIQVLARGQSIFFAYRLCLDFWIQRSLIWLFIFCSGFQSLHGKTFDISKRHVRRSKFHRFSNAHREIWNVDRILNTLVQFSRLHAGHFSDIKIVLKIGYKEKLIIRVDFKLSTFCLIWNLSIFTAISILNFLISPSR